MRTVHCGALRGLDAALRGRIQAEMYGLEAVCIGPKASRLSELSWKVHMVPIKGQARTLVKALVYR